LSTGAATKITDKLYDTFIISGKDSANELSTELQRIFDEADMSPEEVENFAKALTDIDWSSVDSVEELDKIMTEYGVTNTKAIDSIEELEDKIIKASKASRNFDLDKLREELKKSEDLVKDIKGREDNERTFTKEQRDLMVEANPELENQLIATGLDEFTFVGDSMTVLVEALNNNTEAILGQKAEEAKVNAE
jgi:seryl-tRNA synthetase